MFDPWQPTRAMYLGTPKFKSAPAASNRLDGVEKTVMNIAALVAQAQGLQRAAVLEGGPRPPQPRASVSAPAPQYRLGALEERIDQKFKVRKGASTRPQSAPSDPGSAVTAKSSEILELKSALQWVSWSRARLNGEGPAGPGGISTASTETGTRGYSDVHPPPAAAAPREIPRINLPSGGLHSGTPGY